MVEHVLTKLLAIIAIALKDTLENIVAQVSMSSLTFMILINKHFTLVSDEESYHHLYLKNIKDQIFR